MRIESFNWSEECLEVVSFCPVCYSSDCRLIYNNLTDNLNNSLFMQWAMFQCHNCNSAYLNPRPTQSSNINAYSNYHTKKNNCTVCTASKSLFRNFIHSLANSYRNYYYRHNYSPSFPFGWIMIRIFPFLSNRIDEEFLCLSKFDTHGALLDVGFGSGVFLTRASQLGWDVFGADFDPVVVENALKRGLNVRLGGIEAYSECSGYFDLITLNHVLEHVHDPIALLASAFLLLKPGGSLYVATPNIDSYGHKEFKSSWRGLEPPRHLVLFSSDTLRSKLFDVGFSNIQRFAIRNHYFWIACNSYRGSGNFLARCYYLFKSLVINLLVSCYPEKSEFISFLAKK